MSHFGLIKSSHKDTLMSPQLITNIVYGLALIATFVLEHFGLVPNGSETAVLFLITGHAVGSNTPITSAPVEPTGSLPTAVAPTQAVSTTPDLTSDLKG